MADSTRWSERSGAQRRRTLGMFASLYGVVFVIALVLGWIPVAVVFGLGAVVLFIVRSTISSGDATSSPSPERVKPEWLRAMDDPDAPDLTLPEYRGTPTTQARPSHSPFEPPPEKSRGVEPPRGSSDADPPTQDPPPS